MTTTVAVIGGGISGLAAAWDLASALPESARIVLFEADARLGGKLRTAAVGGRPVDLGPDAFVARRDEAVALCEELGLGNELVAPATGRAYVWTRGRLRPLPAGLALGVPTRLGPVATSGICSPLGLGRAALDLLVPPLGRASPTSASAEQSAPGSMTDASVGSLVRRRLGTEVHERLADPLVGGIHAGSTDAMSAAAVFPQLLVAAERPGSLMRALRRGTARGRPPKQAAEGEDEGAPPGAASPGGGHRPRGRRPGTADGTASGQSPVFLSLRGGMQLLADRLAGALAERRVEVRRATAVDGLEARPEGCSTSTARPGWSVSATSEGLQADGTVMALPAPAAATLLGPSDSSLANLLGGIPYASVVLVTFRFPAGAVDRRLEGSGFLVPACEGRLLTACTWLSSKWPELDRRDDLLLRVSLGRYGDDRPARLSDEEVVQRALEELEEMLGLRAPPLEARVTRWPAAFPQYFVGHLRRVAKIEDRTGRLPPLALAGAALHGVGIPACIGSGRRAARTLLGRLGVTWTTR